MCPYGHVSSSNYTPTVNFIGLRDARWDALMSGRKVDTIRLHSSNISEGFMIYRRSPANDEHAVVWVTRAQRVPLSSVPALSRDTGRRSDPDELLLRLRQIYPDITLDSDVDFIEHLTPEETAVKYPEGVSDILRQLDHDAAKAVGLERELHTD